MVKLRSLLDSVSWRKASLALPILAAPFILGNHLVNEQNDMVLQEQPIVQEAQPEYFSESIPIQNKQNSSHKIPKWSHVGTGKYSDEEVQAIAKRIENDFFSQKQYNTQKFAIHSAQQNTEPFNWFVTNKNPYNTPDLNQTVSNLPTDASERAQELGIIDDLFQVVYQLQIADNIPDDGITLDLADTSRYRALIVGTNAQNSTTYGIQIPQYNAQEDAIQGVFSHFFNMPDVTDGSTILTPGTVFDFYLLDNQLGLLYALADPLSVTTQPDVNPVYLADTALETIFAGYNKNNDNDKFSNFFEYLAGTPIDHHTAQEEVSRLQTTQIGQETFLQIETNATPWATTYIDVGNNLNVLTEVFTHPDVGTSGKQIYTDSIPISLESQRFMRGRYELK